MKAYLLIVCIAASCTMGLSCSDNDNSVEPEDTQGTTSDGYDSGIDTQENQETVSATFVVQDAFGSLVEGVDVTFENENGITDQNGAAVFQVPKGQLLHFETSHDSYHDYYVYGNAGQSDFTYVTLASPMALYNQVISAVGVTPDPEKGLVVVSVHDIINNPTVGTKIELNADYEKAFILMDSMPQEGNVILENGQTFVTFANVEPGNVTPQLTPPDGFNCSVFTDGPETVEMEVFPGAISVVTIICIE